MKLGIQPDARGDDIARLHRVLARAGHVIAPDELERQEFGDSTLAALHALQRARGLTIVNEIDAPTLQILLALEENVTININEAGASQSPPKSDQHRGEVSGKLVDGDGAPLGEQRIALFEKQLRAEALLGESRTNAQGAYGIHYHRGTVLNVFARAYDDSGTVIATSPVSFAAAAQIEIDLTTAKDGVVRSLSSFTQLRTKVTAQLHAVPLGDLKENKDSHDIRFVASATGVPVAMATKRST